MSTRLEQRLAKVEAKVSGGGDKVWVVTGRSEAEFEAAIEKMKREREGQEPDLIVYVDRRDAEGSGAPRTPFYRGSRGPEVDI